MGKIHTARGEERANKMGYLVVPCVSVFLSARWNYNAVTKSNARAPPPPAYLSHAGVKLSLIIGESSGSAHTSNDIHHHKITPTTDNPGKKHKLNGGGGGALFCGPSCSCCCWIGSVPVDDALAVVDGVRELFVENLALRVRRQVELENDSNKSPRHREEKARSKQRVGGGALM